MNDSDVERAIRALEETGAVRRSQGALVRSYDDDAEAHARRRLAVEIGAEKAEEAIREALAQVRVETPPRHEG